MFRESKQIPELRKTLPRPKQSSSSSKNHDSSPASAGLLSSFSIRRLLVSCEERIRRPALVCRSTEACSRQGHSLCTRTTGGTDPACGSLAASMDNVCRPLYAAQDLSFL